MKVVFAKVLPHGGARLWLRGVTGAVMAVMAYASFLEPLHAQDLPLTISPLQMEPDRNGVNLADGKMTPDAIVLSVPAAPRLRFDRVQNAAPYINGEQIKNFDQDDISGTWTIHTADGVSEGFRCVFDDDGKHCESVTGSGSFLSFSGNSYRKSGSGERYFLNLTHVFTAPSPSDIDKRLIRQFYASKIEYPDGEVISYTYDTATLTGDPYGRPFYRPNRVSTNLGYYISISYQSSDLTQQGWGTPSVVSLYSSSAPTVPLARLTNNGNGSVTDIAGRVFQGYSLGNLGSPVEETNFSRTLPTEAAASLVVTPAAGLPTLAQMIGTVARDGVSWSYAYTNPQYYAGLDAYHYDAIAVTGPNSYSKTYSITHLNQQSQDGGRNVITRITDELGRQTNYTYGKFLRLVQVQQPEGNSTTLGWDLAGNVISKTMAPKPSSTLPTIVEQSFVDLSAYTLPSGLSLNCQASTMCWRPSWYRDALSRQTDFLYNANGQLTERTDPADANGTRRKTYIEYETRDTGAGLLSRRKTMRVCGVAATCGTNAETRTEYEYLDNTYLPTVERQVDLATGQVRETRYSYDPAGRVLSIDGPRPGVDDATYFRYDILGRKTWEIGARAPNGLRIAERVTYRDSDDKVTIAETGTLPDATSTTLTVLERTDMTYDSRRYQIREKVSAGGQTFRVTDNSFLNRGMPDCTATRMNLAALPTASSTAACSLGTEGAQGADRIVKNTYTAAGEPLQIRRAFGTPLSQNYLTYSYTANGKQQYITDARGYKAQLKYDGHDRQSQWYFPSKTTVGGVSSTDFEQYGYDVAGNRTSLRRRDGRMLAFVYDNLNRIVSKTVPDGCAPIQVGACTPATATRDIFYAYDILDRQLSARFGASNGGDRLTNTYDAFGNLSSSTISMGGFTKTLTSEYDEAGNRSRLTHPDGQSFTYSYDALKRLSGVFQGIDTSVSLDQFSYNARGALATRTERLGSAVSYTYDAIGRMANQTDTFVGGSGNVTIGPIGYNPASQMVSKARNNDAYAWSDAVLVNRDYAVNGLNQYLTAGPATFTYDANGNLTSDGTNTYVYDAENRLVSASNGTSLTYDPMGRLYQIVKNGVSTRLLYDGDALVAEYDDSGVITARYVHGNNAAADDPLVWYSGGATRWLHSGDQGSIVAATNGSGGSPSINTYDEYGIPGTGNVGRFQYTGQAWLAELGMYYYKARMYSPTLGRFLQTDPIGYDDQFNLYAYVGNDPVNGVDPDGMEQIESNTCSRTGSASCSGTYSGDGLKGAASAAISGRGAGAMSGAGRGVAGASAGALATTGALAGTLLLCGDTPDGCRKREDYWYLTYTKQKGAVTYSGRTAGYGKTAQDVLNRRDGSHHMNAQGFGKAVLDRAVKSMATINDTISRAAIRGREQMLIDRNGGARSQGGVSGNAINGISPYNPLRPVYMGAAEAMFGNEF